MLYFLSPTLTLWAKSRISDIQRWINNPIETQYGIWQDIITAGQYTKFGIEHKMNEIYTIEQFKNKVPIRSYENLKPYIDKVLEGQENVLWNSSIKWFAKSSGTTSDKSKFIPISQECLDDCHFLASKDMIANYYAINKNANILSGKTLIIGGSHQISTLNDNFSVGDLSAVLMENSPLIGRIIQTPDNSIALLDEWENKINQMANATIKENVTALAGVPTWTLVILKKILEITGKKNIKEVWPNLELYVHGGVSFIPYKTQFHQLIGSPINYLEVYNASEGFIAAQNDFNTNDLLLFLNHGIFYEFMPIEELDKPNPITHLLHEVKPNKTYAVVISTNTGLWRYLIGDTIQFTSTHPFKIKIVGRTKQFINVFGEEVMVDNTDKAIAIAAEQTGALIKDYSVGPVFLEVDKKGGHEWLIEFVKQPKEIESFIYHLDTALKKLNSDYEAKRHKDIALVLPKVNVLPLNTFETWLKKNNKLGGQHKIPRLSNNRKYIEDILSLQLS